ncbi:TPA: MucBP domain-containing protein, partial [Streptococcus suis]|nr:MucBP domain-containing protein [Streptococcus suis]
MRKSRKNRFDWYSVSQRFSIRKYHIGAVSVLLGSCLLLNGIQAAAETQVAENTQPQVELVTEASPGGAVKATRQVTFTYKVVFVDSNGLTIKEDTLTHSISTTEEKATYSHTLSNLLLPEGYSLASNQDNKLTVTLLEGEVPTVYLNLDVLQVVEEVVVEETPVAPPAEEAGTKEEQATEKVEEPTLETAEEVKPEEKVVAEVPQAPANETVRAAVVPTEPTNPVAQPIVPTSVEEAKHVLEQVTSEAEVLSSQAERLVATSDQENEALKTVAAATKLTATEATVTLNDSKATLEIVNAKIDAVRTNVEALVLELRKFLGTDVIEIALNTTVTNLNVGQGEGVLVETGTTATPSMDDAHGAGIQPHSLRNGIVATTKSGWYTFDSYDLESYNRNQGGTIINGARVEAYMRFSYDSNPNTKTVLAELVSTADGQVLEFHEVSPDGVVEFNYPKTVHANNHKIVLSYRTETAIDGSTYGLVKFSGDNGTVYNNTILPVYQVNTTRYEVKDGRTLATYSLQTIAGQPVTSSGQREFAGFEFVEKKVKSVQGGYPVGSVYVAGVVNNGSNNYKVIRTIVANNAYKHEVFVKDPTYTGTVNYNSLDTTGFFKLVETSGMTYTPDGKSYDYNINSTIYADYTEDPATGLMVFKESAPNSKGSKYRVVAQWSGTGEQGTYGRIYIGTQVWSTTTDKTTDWQWIGTSGKFHNKDYVPAGDQQTLRGAGRPTAVETTYIYRALEQEAIVRYKVEGETTYLEESDILTGGSGSEINYSTEATINKYKKLGYELVSDNFTTEAGQNYDYDTAVRQEFLVVIKPRLVEVPKDVVPGEPVDPEDPNTPKWPNSTGNLERTQEVTRIVAYKYEDGTPVRVDDAGNILPKDSTEGTPLVKTQTVTFSRTATVNLVTGDITYGEWTADSTNVLNGNLIPEITDYSATRTTLEGADAPMTESVNDKTVIATSADINEVVFYTPNPKYGDVVVKYVDTAGTEIATPVFDENDELVGTDYNTAEDNKPEKIINDETGDIYYFKEVKAEDVGKEIGTVIEGTTEVTYIYEKAGNVKINYILDDADGTTLKDSVMDEENAKPGTAYDTTDEGDKPETITKDGKVYRLKEVKADSAAENGDTAKIAAGETLEVTYVYTEVKSDVVVEYYDTEGNLLTGKTDTGGNVDKRVTDTTQASVGTPYNTDEDHRPATITTADGTIYHYIELKKGSAQPEGTVAETTTTVQYVYAKAGSVVIRYVKEDDKGIQSELQPNVLDEDNVKPGTPYDTTDEGNKPTTITTEDGKTYTLVRKEGHDETGEVAAGETKEITYVYKEVTGKVIVNFKSIDGEVLQDPRPDTKEGSTGRDYNTEEKDEVPPTITKDGKTYKLVPNLTVGNPTGKVTPGTTEVTYYYEPVIGDVIIKYTDTEGNTLKDTVIDEDDVIVGTDYDTTNEGDKPEVITTSNGKYVLVPSLTKATDPTGTDTTETGKVLEGTTTITYVYQKVANWIPLIPNVPENERPKTEYPFDPTEPDKEIPSIPTNPTTDKPVIPHVPGYTPVDPKNNTPLTPVDPEDPSKGYVPPTPETPGEDTLIPYVPVKGDVVINYVDTDGNILKSPVTDEDDVLAGTKYDTTDEGDKPTEIVRNGDKYILVPTKTTAVDPAGKSVEETGNVVEGTTTITYVYQKVANWIPLIPNVPENERPKTEYPFDPTEPDKEIPSIPTNPTTDKPVIPHVPGYTPVDPKDNTPLTPVDPEDPNKGYVPPTPETPGKDTLIPYVPVKGDVVINYVDTDGNILKSPVTDEDDVLAGTKYDTTDEGDKPTEIVRNGDKYVLVPSKTTAVDPTGKSVEETGSVVEGTTTITYVYQKVANWIPLIPNVPENKRPKTEYPFDPTEPDKEIPSIPTNPTTDKPVIPHVPGYTPVDPKDNTPLTPVDPEEPSKGYVPPTPETPGEDTLIPYVPVKGDVVIKYVDTDGNTLKDSVTDEDDVLAGTKYDTTDEGDKPTEIVRNGDKYVLVPSKTTAVDPTGKSVEETGSVVEGTTTITYVYQKVANWIPLIPNVPENERPKTEYPFDPTEPDKEIPSIPTNPTTDQPVIPHVPGYTPVDPKDNTPLTPVDPEDPSKGYIPPTPETPGEDTLIPYVPVKGDVVINYVDTDGNILKSPVTDEDDVLAGTKYDTTDEGDKPTEIVRIGDKYVLVPSKTTAVDPTGKSVEETGSVVEGTTTITYVYQKVANWIPLIPNVPENERPKTEYPFDPTEPDKEIPSIPTNPTTDQPVIPHVPGYTPVDPKDNTPLTPVDPEDPSKGYVPPTPETPGEDTLIPYVPVKGDVVINYVDTDGNILKSPVTDEDDVLAGTKYNTTDEGDKPTEIVRNGDKYVLVPSKTTAVDPAGKSVEETGSVVEGTTTITYVYQKVANWIPLIPNVPENERPKTEYPFDPTEPNKEIPSIPTNPTTDQPVIPHVPGYTPVDPKDNTPLTPVDPEDPSKGYVPPTPETPGEDTLIPYVPVKGDVVINYVDTDGNILKSPVTDEDDVLAGTKYNTTDEGDKPTEIVRNGDKYVLVPSKMTAVDPAGKSVEETGSVVEGKTTITYVYQKVANWIPLIPNVPENERPKTEYPFDPTEPNKEIPSIPTNPTTDQPVIPHVPGYTPVDPKDNTPLTPVDPEDPSKGYVPPTPETPGEDTLIPYVPIKNGSVIVTYITEDG